MEKGFIYEGSSFKAGNMSMLSLTRLRRGLLIARSVEHCQKHCDQLLRSRQLITGFQIYTLAWLCNAKTGTLSGPGLERGSAEWGLIPC